MGEGAVHVVGEAASRMLRGHRVHVSKKLSTSATLYPAAVATAVSAAKQGAVRVLRSSLLNAARNTVFSLLSARNRFLWT